MMVTRICFTKNLCGTPPKRWMTRQMTDDSNCIRKVIHELFLA